ncbi:hypothetical protein VTK73DRAFT_10343 [Phialemonium thermophilum]|uniref:Uncharacterized protein n=1 Tax=Phialemonium thermophilum TaxID=223376 RepID=A0ABR3VX99_9PEZI
MSQQPPPPPPPPPPPHGDNPKTTAGGASGLPTGKYDIFIIPEHSAGSGFLYLPSLQPNVNSFVAGFACALACVVLFQSMAPALRTWWAGFQGMGNMGIGGGGSAGSTGGFAGSSGGHGSPPPNSGPPPESHRQQQQQQPPPPRSDPPPHSSWHQSPPPQPGTPRTDAPKNAWEKAREETRKREEERKAREAEQKRKEEAARRLRELREREAREREQREREAREREAKEAKERERAAEEARQRGLREKELRERLEREAREKIERELREKLERERREREERERQDHLRKNDDERNMRKGTSPAASVPPRPTPGAATTSSPSKRAPAPTAKTANDDDDAYSFRPYDKPPPPRKPAHKKSVSDFSESSWTPSQSTARTTPPPSMRGPYTTNDPDKIVIKAVYGFVNQFAKTPASQLLSGVGSVTDGLILRITTEGLFIDDDVRGVAQREWDVKAWTLKLVETGEWKAKGLHLLRATLRDQEGKRFLFVLAEEESWKVAVGLQRLRRGTQVRALGVASLGALETKTMLETLGWG